MCFQTPSLDNSIISKSHCGIIQSVSKQNHPERERKQKEEKEKSAIVQLTQYILQKIDNIVQHRILHNIIERLGTALAYSLNSETFFNSINILHCYSILTLFQ